MPAVLFIIFNRPDTTERVFDAIRCARPSRLYVAADGARNNQPGEAALCSAAREIAMRVDWPCRLQTKFEEKNLGCREAVARAIDWFFNEESEGIILEDDCLPDPDFFRFCAEMLEKYREEDSVFAICGSAYPKKRFYSRNSYAFGRVFCPWGWATWRRAWKKMDFEMSDLHSDLKNGKILESVGGVKERENYWECMFRKTKNKEVNSWDYSWIYTIIKFNGVVAFPRGNLISNLGFRCDATHTKNKNGDLNGSLALKRFDQQKFPLQHPKSAVINKGFEREFYRIRYGVREFSSIRFLSERTSKLISILKSKVWRIVPEETKGFIDYFRFPHKRSAWGGAFNAQKGRESIFCEILKITEPNKILETGTYLGTTTALFGRTGISVYTIEFEPRNFGFSRAQLRSYKNVKLILGDSRAELRRLFRAGLLNSSDRIFAYLDAHWGEDLPLFEEIETIFLNSRESVVMIDDFEVPDDLGYKYDDYGIGKRINLEYILPLVERFNLSVFFPSLPADDETGAKRGCAVIAVREKWGRILLEAETLRQYTTDPAVQSDHN